ncbi:MAG: TRL-like family protein [Victivallales bacterium]|nr:TRL-like family protein [Victivallales bacterium]
MKKLSLIVAALSLVLLAGCATAVPRGGIYSEMTLPALATGNQALTKTTGLKIGQSTCVSWFGMVATGDASIDAACEKAQIKKIYHVDWKVESELPLGIKTVYTTVVYGE